MNRSFNPNLKFGLAMACALAVGAPALAKVSKQTSLITDKLGQPSAQVSFADLDLAQPAGEATLRKRIDAAIVDLCNAPLPEGTFASSQRGGSLVCKRRTLENVGPQVDTLIAAARSGKQQERLAFKLNPVRSPR